MSINTFEEMIQKTKNEIESLNQQIALESNNEAINSQKLVKIFSGIGSSTTEFSLRNRLDEIGKYGNGIVATQKRKAELQKKIASKTSQLYLFEKRLNDEKSKNTLGIGFDFPIELRVSCEQYLLYFAQFLRDLGLNATSNVKEVAGKVLFSVTPTDDFEALDKIREALDLYLSLPSNPISGSTGDRTVDMILSGARANVRYLESQLELAIAKIQFKEATLELKDATIEQNQFALRQKDETIRELKEIVSRGNIFQESLERVEINGEVIDEKSLYRFSREADIEVEATPVLDEKNEETKIGLVKFHEVSKLKDYGVTFDLPKAIRDLIDYFKRDKSSR